MKLSEIFTQNSGEDISIEVYVSTAEEGKPVHKRVSLKIAEGSNIKQLLDALDREKVVGKNFFKKLIKSGKFFTLLVNEKRVNVPDGLEQELYDNDKVALITPMAGG